MQKPKFFYQIFSIFLIIGAIIIILFNTFTLLLSRELLNDQLTLKTQENVYHLMNTLEQRFLSLDRATHSVAMDSKFRDIINNPLSFEEFQNYNHVVSNLNYIASFGPEPTAIDLISLEGNWKIENGSLQQITIADKEQLEKKYSSLNSDLTWINNLENEEIQLVKSISFDEFNPSGILIIRIPQLSLNNFLYRDNRFERLQHTLFISNEEDIIYRDSDLLLDWQKNQNILSSINQSVGNIEIDVNNKIETFVYANSPQSGWTYFLRVNQEDIFRIMQPTIFSIVLMSIIMLILLIIIGYLSSNYFSKPVQSLQQFFSTDSSKKYKDEFESINNSVREIINTNQLQKNVITEQLQQLGTLFLINIFYGVIEGKEAIKKLELFSYPSKWKKMSVCVIQVDTLNNTSYKKEEIEILLFAINQFVKDTISPTDCLPPTVIDSKTQATIMIHQTEDSQVYSKKINDYFVLIQKDLKKRLGISISVGVSSSFEQLTDCKQALKEGREALNHRLNKGKESIIFYEHIIDIPQNKMKFHYPTKVENQMLDYLKSGNREQTTTLLNQLLAELFKHNNSPVQFELSIMRLLSNIVNLMNLLGIDLFTVDNKKTLYYAFLELKTPEEIETYIKDIIIFPILNIIEERENEQYKTLSDQIISIVQKEFDSLITLEIIADRLGYNPNYLSYIFKKELSQSFSEYLAYYRHDIAKKWLRETNMSVKEISEKLQYSNSQNFIRFFRKLEGITPGDFRKSFKENYPINTNSR